MFLRSKIWIVYAVLFGLAIPWYWQFIPWGRDQLWLGMPSWAAAAIAGSLAISIYSAWLLRRRWPGEGAAGEEA